MPIRVGRKKTPETYPSKPKIPPKTSRGEKRTAEKDTTKGITNDSQANSKPQHRRPPASLTSYNYSYLFLKPTHNENNHNQQNATSKKSSNNQNRRASLGRPALKLLRGGGGFNQSAVGPFSAQHRFFFIFN